MLDALFYMRFAFFNVSPKLKSKVLEKSAMGAITYFLILVSLVLGYSLIPEFGLSDENLLKLGHRVGGRRNDLFLGEPHVATGSCFVNESTNLVWAGLDQTKSR